MNIFTRIARMVFKLGTGRGLGVTAGIRTVPVPPTPPVITSAAAFTVAENSAFSATLTANQPVTWANTGGADTIRFGVAGTTVSMSARNFDAPTDADANNVYQVQVTATNPDTGLSSLPQTISVTVTNVNDTNPAAFSFTPVTGVAPGSPHISNAITLTELSPSDSVIVSVVGGALSKNGATFTTSATTGVNGDTFSVHGDASQANSTMVGVTLTAGTTSATFNITTEAGDTTIPAPVQAAADDIVAAFSTQWAGLGSVSDGEFTASGGIVTATSRSAAMSALSTFKGSVSNITKKLKIICDWDGVSGTGTDSAPTGYSGRADGWSDNGGGVYFVAAAGKSPAFGDTIKLTGMRGVHFNGVGFARQWSGSGSKEGQYGLWLTRNATFPAYPVAIVENCGIGAGFYGAPDTHWITGISVGQGAYISLYRVTFKGVEHGLSCPAARIKVIECDFQKAKQDNIHVYPNTAAAMVGQSVFVWLERVTVRNAMDTDAQRANHNDLLQAGHPNDIIAGYRIYAQNVVGHMNHSFAGGGGTQGFYNDDHGEADNQFVLIHNIILTSAPNGFIYHSPVRTRQSYIHGCTFNRSGRVPSGFPGATDPSTRDEATGINLHLTGGGKTDPNTWLTVSETSYGTLDSDHVGVMAVSNGTRVDPRRNVAAGLRPEDFFVGRDFTRGGVAANGISDKFGYDLPNEAGTQAQFVADVMANWLPKAAYAGRWCPDLSGLSWGAPVPL